MQLFQMLFVWFYRKGNIDMNKLGRIYYRKRIQCVIIPFSVFLVYSTIKYNNGLKRANEYLNHYKQTILTTAKKG